MQRKKPLTSGDLSIQGIYYLLTFGVGHSIERTEFALIFFAYCAVLRSRSITYRYYEDGMKLIFRVFLLCSDAVFGHVKKSDRLERTLFFVSNAYTNTPLDWDEIIMIL